jgi:ligand-binding SRPBCC domain-containing protein
MPLLHLTTFIAAPADRVFNLSRSINFHRNSMDDYAEQPINGRTSGLICNGETVTWKARHLRKTRFLKVKITAMSEPYSFTDEMVSGDFRKMKHEHFFKACENGTLMIDQFYFESPYGIFGRLFNSIFLARYMQQLLVKRNRKIKEVAESNQWKHYLETTT